MSSKSRPSKGRSVYIEINAYYDPRADRILVTMPGVEEFLPITISDDPTSKNYDLRRWNALKGILEEYGRWPAGR